MGSMFAIFFLLLVSSTFQLELTAENCGLPIITENTPIDEELYSRQLFVYGKTAQKRLASSRILVHGHGSLAAEIVKNLALAGVGNIVIGGKESYDRLCGESSDLISYARALNSQIKVEREENVTISNRFTTAIFIDDNISSLRSWNKLCREAGVKMVGSVVRGMCGVIFDDFLDFLIEDIEGDISRDVPIKSMISKGDTIEISCVDEERFNELGIGDLADIDWNTGTTKYPSNGVQVQVEDIVNTKTVRAKVLSSEVAALDLSNEGRPVLRKSKQSRMVVHKSLDDCLARPKFSPLNGCLPTKRDRASCITLLAAFIAFERIGDNNGAQLSTALFRTAVLTELNEMGVKKPLRPIKQGGVGADTLDAIVGRFLSSLGGLCPGGGACPGVVSVVGALSAQEVIKSITHVHTPVDQIFLFESLDSLAHGVEGRKLTSHDSGHQQLTGEALRCYGHELAEELAGLRIFVVGAGAIGCEILKTLALMGAATGTTLQTVTVDSSEEEAKQVDRGASDDGNLWSGLSGGGVVITDMDHIEKSNLNRQLLFRERHIGQSKAMTAVEMIKKINPRMNIRGQSTKLCPSTENVFNSAFWGQADVVLTALDNVDARRYVDEQCVKYKRWLVDSGTLGTVGSTQVVIPFVSESYSSSADPPEDMIPMCTLKSFPYQPEHCIAWSRSIFDQNFNEDVKLIRSFLELSCSDDDSALADAVSSATSDEIDRLLDAIACLDQSRDALVKWAIDLFDDIFSKQAESLLKEHPLDERDDEGIPFWGGSRRVPAVVKFDVSNIDHCQFIIWASTLRGRAMGLVDESSDLRGALDDYLASVKDDKVPSTTTDGDCGVIDDKPALAERTLKRIPLDEKRRAILNLEPQEFEKDNLSLGHIDFSTVASNLRCQVYAIRQVDRLEVQKIAGKIIPAVATTTAAVAGLVCLEVLKIAAERVRAKRMNKLHNKPSLEKLDSRHQGVVATVMDAAKKWVRVDAKEAFLAPSGAERERLLLRFRNSFLNLARPLFAFSQPVEVEFFSAGGSEFSMWSTIDINRNADKLTIAEIESFLARRFNVQLQSVSLGDILLYADFMPDSCGDKKISALIRSIVENDATESDEGVDDGRRPHTDSERVSFPLTSFVDLNVVCIDADGVDVRLPLLRVSLPSTSAVGKEGAGSDMKDKSKRPFSKFKSWFEKKKTG